MYWYLSFLRPPPTAAPAGGSITITPQIANDLRTELKYEPTEIYYTWQLLPLPTSSTSSSSSSSTPSPTTSPVVLTRWDPPMTTYKPLSIPLPPRAAPGQYWRLGLSVPVSPPRTSSSSHADPIAAPTNKGGELLRDGCGILGVWSEGIRITPSVSSAREPGGQGSITSGGGHTSKKVKLGKGGKGGKGGEDEGGKGRDGVGKQTRIVREFAFDHQIAYPTSSSTSITSSGQAPLASPTLPTSGQTSDSASQAVSSSLLRIIEQTSFDLDKKVWDSGLALGAWLWRGLVSAADVPSGTSMPAPASTPCSAIQENLIGEVLQLCAGHDRIIELGSGTGLVGIILDLALRARATAARGARAAGAGPLEGTSPARGSGDGLQEEAPGGKGIEGGRIVATDLPSAIELMQENIALNSPPPSSLPKAASPSRLDPSYTSTTNGEIGHAHAGRRTRASGNVHARVLNWDSPLPEWVGEDSWPGLIIAADVTYNTASFPSLLSTLIALLNPSNPQNHLDNSANPAAQAPSASPRRPLLVLAYKERDPAERDLWQMLSATGVEMVLVDKVQGAEERGETEIWVGRYID